VMHNLMAYVGDLFSKNDNKLGIQFELYAVNDEAFENGNQIGVLYDPVDVRDILMKNRIVAVSAAGGLLVFIFILQLVLIRYFQNEKKEKSDSDVAVFDSEAQFTRIPIFTFSNYALATAMANSFLAVV